MMSDTNLVLVSSIEKFPCLYNNNLQDYMKKDVTEKAWSEVSTQASLSVAECKEKWRNLRYSLLRSLKPNADGTQKRKYYLHKEMEFLIPFMKSKTGFGTQFEEEIDEDLSTNDLNIDVTSPHQQLFEYEYITSEPNKKKKKVEQHSYYNQSFVPNVDNSRKLFLLGILPEINALSGRQMKVFRRKVLALLDDITGDMSINFEEDLEGNGFSGQVKPEPNTDEDRNVYTVN